MGASEYNNTIKSLEELAKTLTASILEAIETDDLSQADAEIAEGNYFERMEKK